MFSIAHNDWTRADQGSRPQLQCLRAADASSLAHQVAHSSSHSLYAAGSSRQIQFGILLICSEMVDPSEELANDHAYDAQSCGLLSQVPELFEHGFEIGTIGEIESLAGKSVDGFAQRSARQPAIASASAVLQSADEMEVTELHDPTLGGAKLDDSRYLVGDRGTDAFVYGVGDRCNHLRPALQVLPPWQQHRIEEHRSMLMTRLDRHQIQDPVFSSKAEVNSVQEQNQRAWRQAQNARSRYRLSQRLTKPPTQRLTGKAVARSQSLQCTPVQQDYLQNSRTHSPKLAASPFLADSPRSLAATALTTSRTKPIDFGSATWRFRVPRMHARELHTD